MFSNDSDVVIWIIHYTNVTLISLEFRILQVFVTDICWNHFFSWFRIPSCKLVITKIIRNLVSGTNNQSNFKPKLTIFSSYRIPAYYNVRVQNINTVSTIKFDVRPFNLKVVHHLGSHPFFHFEIDCQIIGSKHFLVCTLDFLEQKVTIISNLKFESSVFFWDAKRRLTERIFTLNNFVFVLGFVMLHSIK